MGKKLTYFLAPVLACSMNSSDIKHHSMQPVQPMQQINHSSLLAKPSQDIPILMFHHIDKNEHQDKNNHMICSYNRFMNALNYLHDNNYQMISFAEAASGNYKKIMGKHPVVLTFDDGTYDQFNYLADGAINPNCAVGILENFKNLHPNYRVTGTFFVNMNENLAAFGKTSEERKKLIFLSNNDYEIGSHGARHIYYGKSSLKTIQDDQQNFIDKANKIIPEYKIKSFAYPYGNIPSAEMQKIVQYNYPNTARAWGGIAHAGTSHNLSRIEFSYAIQLSNYCKKDGGAFEKPMNSIDMNSNNICSDNGLIIDKKLCLNSKSNSIVKPIKNFNTCSSLESIVTTSYNNVNYANKVSNKKKNIMIKHNNSNNMQLSAILGTILMTLSGSYANFNVQSIRNKIKYHLNSMPEFKI